MFDYIFYRLYCFYYKNEKGRTPVSTAVLYLSVLQILILFFLYMLINISLKGKISLKELQIDGAYLKLGFVVFALLLNLLNYINYKRKYKTLVEKFKNHPLNKKLKLWMLYIIGAGLFLFPFLYSAILKIV